MTGLRPHVEPFRALVTAHLGLVFDDGKLEMLEELLRARSEAAGVPAQRYLARLEAGPRDELAALAGALTVGETYFYRNVEQFRAFAETVLPDRVRARGAARSLRLLSAGCASGEEAFTLAIVVRQAQLDPGWSVSIRAVDVNRDALERADRARYTTWSLRETPADIQRAWFRGDGRELVLDPSIRGQVQLEEKNLVAEDADLWAPATYDAIFCRNVLMYFSRDTASRVIARCARALAPGGYLFLGHAETLRGMSQDFHLCHTHGTFYYHRLPHGAAAGPGARAAAPLPTTTLAEAVGAADSWVDAIHQASERIRQLAGPRAAAEPAHAARWDLGAALALLQQERFSDALAALADLPAASAGDPDVLLLRAVLLVHRGHFALAEQTCERLLGIDDHSAGAHYVLALGREGAGDGRGAVEHDQVALWVDPTFAMARLHLGLLARRAGDHAAARRELAQAIVLLEREEASRLLLFGGGFQRDALIALCKAELAAVGGVR